MPAASRRPGSTRAVSPAPSSSATWPSGGRIGRARARSSSTALPETAAIWESNGLAVPPDVRAAIDTCRFNPTVFVAPYWPDIYCQDAERKQTPEQAAHYAALTAPTYAAAGYRPVELPRVPVAERVAFVLQGISRGHVP